MVCFKSKGGGYDKILVWEKIIILECMEWKAKEETENKINVDIL